jgi:hypothetical protein
MSFMLSVANKPITLSVVRLSVANKPITLSVVMLNVVKLSVVGTLGGRVFVNKLK